QQIILDVSGVGFNLSVADEHAFTVGQKQELQVYFHWNTEQGPQLFGFTSKLSKTVFSLIISCSGIGPKIGLAALAQLSPESFLQAILLNDIKTLSSLSGIGTKKAEALVLCLKDKVSKLDVTTVSMPGSEGQTLKYFKQVSDALSSLNYSRSEIAGALEFVKKNSTDTSKFDEMLRKALSFLSKKA
nr:Holliday junction branch migration protein RuvA [Candidatus Dependentiae bacterium]